MKRTNLKAEQLFFYIGLGLCLILSSVFLLRGVLPKLKARNELRKELAQKEGELRRRYNIVPENKKLTQEIAEVEKKYGDLNEMLFSPDDISPAVKEIANISKDLQIDFISLVPLPAQKLTSSPEVGFSLWETPISIKMKSGYLKLLDFLKKVENSQKFMKLKDFRITKNPSALLIHDIQLTLGVYSLQQEKAK